jgi:hypothetical protein
VEKKHATPAISIAPWPISVTHLHGEANSVAEQIHPTVFSTRINGAAGEQE